MISRFLYYIKVAWKKYHFIIPLSKIKIILKNRHNQVQTIFSPPYYQNWLKNIYPVTNYDELKYKPLISVIIPVYNVKKSYLERCIDSVLNQSYDNFEICIVDDASTLKETIKTLKKYEDNKKIKIKYHQKNTHISKTSNDAIKMSKGEFIILLDNDDFIEKDALYEVVKALNNNPNLDLIYSDEDKSTTYGKYLHSPVFKPDYSPIKLESTNFICHLVAIRKTIFDKAGGFRLGYEGVQDWDLLLRITSITNRIYHIPRVLYHWVESDNSTALSINNKPYVIEKTKLLMEEIISKRKYDAKLINNYDNVFKISFNKPKELVSIILINNGNYLKCIKSIDNNTDNYEIIINKKLLSNSDYKTIKDKYKNIVFIDSGTLNESKMINDASKVASGKYLLILNSNLTVTSKDWLNNLVGYAKDNGAIGANIIVNNKYICYGDVIWNKDTIQTKITGIIDDPYGIYLRNAITYDVSIVKDTCLMIQKEKFDLVGGFDETLPHAYNDIDFCFKLLQKGYSNIIEPGVKLLSNKEKIYENDIKEKNIILERWSKIYKNDPYYNINLDDQNPYNLRTSSFDGYKHIFIIGSRGYGFNYGGWETFITNLIDYYKSDKIIFHVSGIGWPEEHKKINEQLYFDLFPLNRIGKLQMYMHTKKSMKYYEKYIKENHIQNSVVYILGLKLGFYLGFSHKRLNKQGIKIMVNPDGLEWKRGKYGIIGKLYFIMSARSMLNHCDLIICDAKGIYDFIVNKYKHNKIEKRIITYGTNKYSDYLTSKELSNKFNLKKDDYLLVVGRLVPENNLSFIIKEYLQSNINKKLVIVTNETKDNFDKWCKDNKIILNDNIIFLSSIYNEKDIFSLRYYAYAYIHGHSVGGTNPSLLESLYTTKLVIAYDVAFNSDICKDSALYFNLQKGNLTKLFNNLSKYDSKRLSMHKKAINIIEKNHTWEYIVNEYKKIWEGK